MFTPLLSAFVSIRSWFRPRAALQVEILGLRHQLSVLKRSQHGRLHLNSADRRLWVLPSRFWSNWRSALLFVKPETVIAWHRRDSAGIGDGRVGTANREGRRSTWGFGFNCAATRSWLVPHESPPEDSLIGSPDEHLIGNHPNRHQRSFARHVVLYGGFEERLEECGESPVIRREASQDLAKLRQPLRVRHVFDGRLGALRVNTVDEQNPILFSLIRQHQDQRVVESQLVGERIKFGLVDALFAWAGVPIQYDSTLEAESFHVEKDPTAPRLIPSQQNNVATLDFLKTHQSRLI